MKSSKTFWKYSSFANYTIPRKKPERTSIPPIPVERNSVAPHAESTSRPQAPKDDNIDVSQPTAKTTSGPQAPRDDIVTVPKPTAKSASKPQAPKDDNMHKPQPPAQSTSGSQAPPDDAVSVPQTPAESTYVVTKAPASQVDGRENSSAPKVEEANNNVVKNIKIGKDEVH